jgi:hypothetical protein
MIPEVRLIRLVGLAIGCGIVLGLVMRAMFG